MLPVPILIIKQLSHVKLMWIRVGFFGGGVYFPLLKPGTSAFSEKKLITEAQTQTSCHGSTPPSSHHADELTDANSQPTPSVRVQGPTDDKQRQATSNRLPHIILLALGNSLSEQRSESDPTVLLNSTHSLLAWPRPTQKPQKLAFGVYE